MADWVTISSLATAGGTLVLAVATFASVRSANRAARVAELSVMANLRPLLVQARLDDVSQKIGFAQEGEWLRLDGGHGAARVDDGAILLAMSIRNVGQGIAVLDGWRIWTIAREELSMDPPDLAAFTRLTRDIFVPSGDVGFWQGTFRDPATEEFAEVRRAVQERRRIAIDVLYGDVEGGQRAVTRFGFSPAGEDQWLVAAGRVWNLDGHDPR
jgi:hypothetical protein